MKGWYAIKQMNPTKHEFTSSGNIICLYDINVMVIVVGNGHGDTSSNPGRD